MFDESNVIKLKSPSSYNSNESKNNTEIVNLPNLDEILNSQIFLDSTITGQKYNVRRNPQNQIFNRMLKRGFDITFSLLAIILVGSWLFPILAVFVMFDSKGSAFYLQRRSGKNNTVFNCIKFRTMKFEKQARFKAATKNDNRVTRLGSFLRKTSLDELPQLFNVLSGEMSIVGPRPHAIETDIEYKKMVAKYDYRLAVKPGITGLAQSKGYRGETLRPIDMSNRIRIDIFYIENWSFSLDIKIIFLTILNIFKGDKNAY